MNISFIGLGKLGLCSAACFASKGHHVVGVDSNERVIRELRDRHCPIDETGLPELLDRSWDAMEFTTDYGHAVRNSDATLIIVPTPSRDDGRFSNAFVEQVLVQIAPALAAKDAFHIVDVVSTVMPTTSETVFKPLLERLTGKVCGADFGLVYNPEFIALGSVIKNFLSPDMVLIGASDDRSGETIKDLYASMVESAPFYAVMDLTNAEITKLSLNCCVTMKISFANELAAICEHVPGANVDVVTTAIGADSRIGCKYLKGGLGFGGPCFPRDNRAFQMFAADAGYTPRLSPQVVTINNSVVDRIETRIRPFLRPGDAAALFGVSYKNGTHIIEESQAIMLARRLAGSGFAVRLHDPKALASAKAELGDSVTCCPDPYEAAKGARAIVLLTDWKQFAGYDWTRIDGSAAPGAVLFDCWRTMRAKELRTCSYIACGLGTTQSH